MSNAADRYPLRQAHWSALGAWVSSAGTRRVARDSGVSIAELDEIIAARSAPTVSDRCRLVRALQRQGKLPPARGDLFAPDGTEWNYGLAAHPVRCSTLPPKNNDRDQARRPGQGR